ncbi:MAG: oxygen-dependent coproporphyrinogen oxidase [Bacteroidia bacterium]|jgi:coproporphyrinogen III oxidase
MVDKLEVETAFRKLQNEIIDALEKADGLGVFRRDEWKRDGGGGGITAIMEQGTVIEKGGVNFSAVFGELSKEASKALGVGADAFYATGVSIVLHPKNPFVPIIHMNIRYFETENGQYWFGGGIDLTPHYVDENDVRYFHDTLKRVCDTYNLEYYPEFKNWADTYFFLPHRNETRGVGGIFFDRLDGEKRNTTKNELFQFVLDVGKSFAPIYVHFIERHKNHPFTDTHRKWQLLRRGRYVEFNLLYDRGTRFGLETGGRTESILMSLPAEANWQYDYTPLPGSPEAATLNQLKKGIPRV